MSHAVLPSFISCEEWLTADAAPIGICLRFSMYFEGEQMHKMLEVRFDCNCAIAWWVRALFFCVLGSPS